MFVLRSTASISTNLWMSRFTPVLPMGVPFYHPELITSHTFHQALHPNQQKGSTLYNRALIS